MVRIIGILEIFVYYAAYFTKAVNQRKRGIQTNQLGIGNKARKTVIIEKILRLTSIVVVPVMLVSMFLNTTLLHNPILRAVGLILIGTGTGLFITAMITMKDSWRAGIPDKDRTKIVTAGIYKISRNPAFLGFDLTYIGACLAFSNILVIIMTVIVMIMMHLQILEEEKFLQNTFGDEYIAYKKRTGRYFLII